MLNIVHIVYTLLRKSDWILEASHLIPRGGGGVRVLTLGFVFFSVGGGVLFFFLLMMEYFFF